MIRSRFQETSEVERATDEYASGTTHNPTQIMRDVVESACVAVVVAAGAQLSEEFSRTDTSSATVTRRETQSESEELTATIQKEEARSS